MASRAPGFAARRPAARLVVAHLASCCGEIHGELFERRRRCLEPGEYHAGWRRERTGTQGTGAHGRQPRCVEPAMGFAFTQEGACPLDECAGLLPRGAIHAVESKVPGAQTFPGLRREGRGRVGPQQVCAGRRFPDLPLPRKQILVRRQQAPVGVARLGQLFVAPVEPCPQRQDIRCLPDGLAEGEAGIRVTPGEVPGEPVVGGHDGCPRRQGIQGSGKVQRLGHGLLVTGVSVRIRGPL